MYSNGKTIDSKLLKLNLIGYFEKKNGKGVYSNGKTITVNAAKNKPLKINLIGLNNHAIQKEFLCMSATRYKFISVIQGRHVRSTNYIVLFPQAQITLLRYI